MTFPSHLIENAVQEFERLPGIGKKTALRLVLYLLKEPHERVLHFSETIERMRREIKFCKNCYNVSDHEVCAICSNPRRNHAQICVVESIRDVIAIENTNHFQGLYHVLGGIISPVDGIGPEKLHIEPLVKRVKENQVQEIIMALNPTIQGDTTIYYISKRLEDTKVRLTTLARGVAFGGELEYVDDMTLARSITKRLPYESYLVEK